MKGILFMSQNQRKMKKMFGQIQHTFQDAEKTVLGLFHELSGKMGYVQDETKKKIDSLLVGIAKSSKDSMVDGARAKVAMMRQDFEIKVEESTELLWDRLGLATKDDIDHVLRKVVEINKRLKEVETKIQLKEPTPAVQAALPNKGLTNKNKSKAKV